jgi:hypothetical protein
MISGPSGTGKTYSALRLAKGIAGPDGSIFVADTDNSRARLYANDFSFMHLDLREPFRPMLFEQAAIAAQKQGASVLIVDNFGHEWSGPGGVLEWHEEELTKAAGDNYGRREALKVVMWARVKPPHKKMLQRLYQLNMAIILCAFAERKIAMVKQVEGKDKGKVIPIDLGFQPVGDKDAAFAMTVSLLLEDVTRPGTPRPIKALLPDLQPIIHLDRPLDEETGRRIAAWARGEKEPVAVPPTTGSEVREEIVTQKPPPSPEPPESDQLQDGEPPPTDRELDIAAGAQKLADKFLAVADRQGYHAIMDDKDDRKQVEWLRKNRRELFNSGLDRAMKAAWQRTDPQKPQDKQGDLV